MGRRGPRPEPSAFRRLKGTLAKAKSVAKREPKPSKGRLSAPESVENDEIARGCWHRHLPMLQKMRVIAPEDLVSFEGFCMAYSRAKAADADVEDNGITMMTVGGVKANPACNISTRSWAEVRRFAQEFGLTPSARTRISASEEDPDEATEESSAEDFLFGGKVVGSIGPR